MNKDLRIIFLGTPDFAVPSLAKLVENGYNIVAVITAPDKPAGRGLQLQQSPVKKYALTQNIPVLQPEKLKNSEFLEELKSYNADLQIVIAFRMLPELVWNMPKLGTFNLHASLLPQYRGAAPINRAIMNGEKETGLTTFFLQHEIDTGHILLQEKMLIGEDETAGELHDRMMLTGADLVLRTVEAIENNSLNPVPQKENEHIKHAPKIFKEDCRIDWNWNIDQIHNHIRGLSPYPAAWTTLQGKNFKIYKTKKEEISHIYSVGKILTDGKTYMKVAANGGFIHLLEVQMEGKKRLPVSEFLKGFQPQDLSFQ
ncbi:MAG: methionyl-tRNA formyltransferase [Bacteroidia bacterium]